METFRTFDREDSFHLQRDPFTFGAKTWFDRSKVEKLVESNYEVSLYVGHSWYYQWFYRRGSVRMSISSSVFLT